MANRHPINQFRAQPMMAVAEHEARVAKSTMLLGKVNDKYEALENKARHAALFWDAERKMLQGENGHLRELYNTNFKKFRWILGLSCGFALTVGLVVGKLL